MLRKIFRLKGKDVNFLSKKRQYFGAGLFGFFYRKQYPQIAFHQISLHITIKYSKKASQRNVLKRGILAYIHQEGLVHKPISTYFYKIFIVMNKSKLEEIHKKIANFDKKHIIEYIQKEFAYAREAFTSRIAR